MEQVHIDVLVDGKVLETSTVADDIIKAIQVICAIHNVGYSAVTKAELRTTVRVPNDCPDCLGVCVCW